MYYLILILINVLYFNSYHCDEHNHKYKNKEQVVLWMNTIGSFYNRQDTYAYFDYPFCKGTVNEIEHYHETLAETLLGIELEFSRLDIKFKENVTKTKFCGVQMDDEKLSQLENAISNSYQYQMYLDELPIWGVVGEKWNDKYYVFKHKKFILSYNGDRIVDVNFTVEDRESLDNQKIIDYSYEVHWVPSNIPFNMRFEKYLDSKFYQHKIHWFSIFNSFMMVIFLVGLVSMIIVRTLRKDYARYCKDEDDMEKDFVDDYGWKQVHGDVFRSPSMTMLYSTVIGVGHQIILVTLCVIVFAIIGDLYEERGSLLTTIIFVFAGTSSINGFFGASLYARLGGKLWIRQMLFSTFLIPVLVCGTSFFINFIAMYYHNSHAIPFGSMVAILCICVFIVLPLNLIGTVLGRNLCGYDNYPCRVNAVPRPIPEKKWFTDPTIIILLGGILPFASIFIEMYFIFTSFWAYKIYYVYGFMLLVFLILIVVTICVSIVCTYFLLNSEDYRWHWTSFLTGASTATYVYLYSIYYFYLKTKMFGVFQTAFYFGNMALFSIILGIMCGTIGFIGTNLFVHKIYSTVKID